MVLIGTAGSGGFRQPGVAGISRCADEFGQRPSGYARPQSNDQPDRALLCGIVSLNFRLWGYIGIPTVGPLNPMPILDSDAPCPCADAGVAAHAGEADRIDVEGRIKAGRDGAQQTTGHLARRTLCQK